MIELCHLRKAFAGKPAVHDLSLEVRRGEIFGLLGHNGAGKSTTLGILLGQVFPDAGEALINGVSVQQHRAQALGKTGAIFEAPRFYDYLSGWRNLEIYTSYSARVPQDKIAEAVETVASRHAFATKSAATARACGSGWAWRKRSSGKRTRAAR